jgi:alpha-1,6-mannosyltransferase
MPLPLDAASCAPVAAESPELRSGAKLLRVVDVAMFYGERSGGIRTYVRRKADYAAAGGRFEHHVIIPGRAERHLGGWHEVRALQVAASNGYRLPLGTGALRSTLRAIRPDVVLLHDPFWGSRGVADLSDEQGAIVLAVHHGSSELNAAALPGPHRIYASVLRAWMRHAYGRVDGVMSVVDPYPDSGRRAALPLRFGVDPAFRPRPGASRGGHVLYAGRLSREKGVFELLEAAGRSATPWRLHLVGTGPAERHLRARAARLGLSERIRFLPYVNERRRLAQLYAEAGCVVMPGAYETFGLVCLEAPASGGCVVACETAPSARLVGPLAETFRAGNIDGLLAAIERARSSPGDAPRAARLARSSTWERALEAELRDVARLLA